MSKYTINNSIPETLEEIFDDEKALDRAEHAIKEKRKKILEAKKEYASLPSIYSLAITLHKKICHFNHTDGCGWYYEIQDGKHNWHCQTHDMWLKKASKVENFLSCNRVDPNNIGKLIDLL